jgi:hypothetical protein
MKPSLYLFIAPLALALASCGGTTETSELPILDVEAAIADTRNFDLSEIAESIEFIPLDDSVPESLLGDPRYTGDTKNNFYFINTTNKPVLVFDKSGKFKYTLGSMGRGPDEFLQINGLATDYENDNLYLNVRSGEGYVQSMVAYDSAGRLFARLDSVRFSALTYYKDELVFSKPYPDPNASDFDPNGRIPLLERWTADLKPAGTFDVLNKESNYVTLYYQDSFTKRPAGSTWFSMANNGESLLLKEVRSDTLYHYDGGPSLIPAYFFNMGTNSFPEVASMELSEWQKWSSDNYQLYALSESDRYVFATIAKFMQGEQEWRCLIFDRDESYRGFTPIGGKNNAPLMFLDDIDLHMIDVRDNRMLGWFTAIEILDNAATITNPELKALAATLKEDSNPVMVVIHLKK